MLVIGLLLAFQPLRLPLGPGQHDPVARLDELGRMRSDY